MTPEEEGLALRLTGEAHPLADIFPLMEGDEFEALVDDIRANGLRAPVLVTPEGLILDGRNRFRACKVIQNVRLERTVPEHARLRVHVPAAPREQWAELVMSMNLHRRHLSAGQRAMTAARWGLLKVPGVPVPSQEGRAREVSVGLTTLKQAETVLRSGDIDLIAKVDAGDLPVYRAAERLKARERRDRQPVRREDKEQPEPLSVEQWLDQHVQDVDAPAERDLLDQGDVGTLDDPTLHRSVSVRRLQEPEQASEPERAPEPAPAPPAVAWSFEAWKNLTLSCPALEGMTEMRDSFDGLLRSLRLRIEKAEWDARSA